LSSGGGLRVVMLSADFRLPPYGGIAAHLAGLCPALARQGLRVTLVVPGYGRGEERSEFEGVEVIRLRRWRRPRFLRYFGRLVSLRKALGVLLGELEPDLLHVHDLLVSPPLARGFRRRFPVVFTNHTSVYVRWSESAWRRPLLRLLVGRPDGIIAVSPVLEERSRAHRPVCLELIPSGVDTDRFQPSQPDPGLLGSLGLAADDPVVLYVGRLAPVKGLPHLVAAIGRIRAAVPGVRLLIAGGGSEAETEALTRVVAEAGLEEEVNLLGPVPHELLPRYYALASVVALPSLMEATSIAGLEAMACGAPLVGTRVGGLPIIVDEGVTGLLVPPGDATSLAGALERILLDDDLRRRMGGEARRRAERRFSWNGIAERTAEFYRSVLRARRGEGGAG